MKTAENELLFSLRKSYDLYYYFLLLIIALTNLLDRTLDNRKHKYVPTSEELHPNMRLVNNRFAQQLSRNDDLRHYVNEYKISWDNDQDFLKTTLNTLLASDLYAEYAVNTDDSYETDREFWRAAFKTFVLGNEAVSEYLEDKSIFWNDDVEIVGTFTLKTIKHFREHEGSRQSLLPMFNDEEARMFSVRLLRETLLHGPEIRERISRRVQNWETERVANIDLIIMQIAIAEMMSFPSIPVSVTLNEYIDMAKYYSTPKSGIFINGILDAIVDELKKEGILFKD
jgi:N utilization substance protein B